MRNPGLRALLAVAGFETGETPSAHQVAFRLAPRINAAGRMATASDIIELFLTSDEARALALAEQLDALNRERQQVEAEIVETILQQCEENSALAGRQERFGIQRTGLASRRARHRRQPSGGTFLPARLCAERRA